MEFTSIVPAVSVKLCVNCLFEWQGCFCHYAPPNRLCEHTVGNCVIGYVCGFLKLWALLVNTMALCV